MENQFDTSSWNGSDIPLGTSPVASLDSPLVQQTKSEIRTLAAEIAELAHADLSASEFYEGFLPRLCVAMGASGAAIWECASPPAIDDFVALAQHQLPAPLFHSDASQEPASAKAASYPKPASSLPLPKPSAPHATILQCVANEGQPILVPPSTTSIDADRPVNPIEEALILVPVRLEKSVEFLIEVTQSSTGGPAAQRGYLRFVAQMGDLFADYIRRNRLREHAERLDLVERREDYVLQMLRLSTEDTKRQLFVDACMDLFAVNQAFCFDAVEGKILSPISVGQTTGIDARNPVFAAVRKLITHLASDSRDQSQGESHQQRLYDPICFAASERRSSAIPPAASESHHSGLLQQAVDQLCELLGSRDLILYQLNSASPSDRKPRSSATWCLLATRSSESSTLQPPSLTTCLHAETLRTLVAAWQAGSESHGLRSSVRRAWQHVAASATLLRVLIAIAVLAICVVPVPQRVSVSALLQPVERNQYYAPSSSIVSEIHVQEGQWVEADQPLLTLTSQQLDHELDRLEGERQTTLDRITELRAALTRGEDLEQRNLDRLENEYFQKQHAIQSLESQLSVVRAEIAALTIRAKRSGQVTTWDVKNNLANRPVQSGASLLTTCRPNGEWEIQLSIPDHRIGLVQQAMNQSDRGGLNVRFSLRSQPDTVVHAELRHLGFQIQNTENEQRFLLARAAFPAASVPLKQNGSAASATIECGDVPFGWLIVRDAYTATRTFIELNL
ncbi:MAG: biotin/lipoyl-binding protein [Planctomycetota bacterium]